MHQKGVSTNSSIINKDKNITSLHNKYKKLKYVYKYDIESLKNNRLESIKNDLDQKRYPFKHIILILNNIYRMISNKHYSSINENTYYQKMKVILNKDINELRHFVNSQRKMKNNSKLYIEPKKDSVTISIKLKMDNGKYITHSKKMMIHIRDWYQERMRSYTGCVLSNINILNIFIKNKNIIIIFSCFGLDEDIEVEKKCLADPDQDANYPLKILNNSYIVIGKEI
jgi:hypothetical protein